MIEYITHSDSLVDWIRTHAVKVGATTKKNFVDIVFSLDIETTRLPDSDESIMYIWQFGVENHAFYGRYWEELIDLFSTLNSLMEELDGDIIVYVHNLSFEFQFLRTIFRFTDVLCLKKRSVLRARYNHIELRCSYRLSNMSLDAWTEKYNVKHKKLSGLEYDYSKIRYPWTELTAFEMLYTENDVLGLNECIRTQLKVYDDNLNTIPLTSTGYVRRDARNAMWRIRPKELFGDAHLYELLSEAFRGGNTHANRYYVGNILSNVYSADRSSSYPDVQVNCEFPMKPFHPISPDESNLERYTIKYQYPVLVRIKFINIRQADIYDGFPYLSFSKCKRVINPVLDNGRILAADSLITTLTDIDLRIVYRTYKWDRLSVEDMMISRYGPLPTQLTDVIRKYYIEKTALKDDASQELYYTKSKNMLNSVYGMTAQNPGKQNIIIDGLEYVEESNDISAVLQSYYKSAFLPYSWGVWTTAWARYRLQEGLWLAGDDAVYCDTDSIKSINPVDWTSYNISRKQDSIKNRGSAKDSKGKIHYLGVFEPEKTSDRFITWGAKKYCCEIDGELKVVVSGVRRKTSAKELEAAGGIEAFNLGMVFVDSGGAQMIYNDHQCTRMTIDGHSILVPSSATLVPHEYTLGITSEYDELLNQINF